MPDSPKIWGTLELEKQGDWLQSHLPGRGRGRPDPREVRSGVQPGGDAPQSRVHSPPVGNQPINTSY